jgi:hypothetical protein
MVLSWWIQAAFAREHRSPLNLRLIHRKPAWAVGLCNSLQSHLLGILLTIRDLQVESKMPLGVVIASRHFLFTQALRRAVSQAAKFDPSSISSNPTLTLAVDTSALSFLIIARASSKVLRRSVPSGVRVGIGIRQQRMHRGTPWTGLEG